MTTAELKAITNGGSSGSASLRELNNLLGRAKNQLALALPKHLNADRMTRLALTAYNQSSQLQKCSPRSIAESVLIAAQMGLEIGVAGQGYLVPYKNKATFVPGWQGIVDIVSRSGRATVWTGAVFEGDKFEFALGDSPFVKHQPSGEDDPNKITHVYAVGRVNGSQWPVIEVWPIERVKRHFKKHNKVGNQHYAWNNWEMYARKVPLLQVCKYMPKSIELTSAIQASHAAEEGRPITLDGDFITVSETLVDADTGEITGAGAPPPQEPAPTYADFAERIKQATSAETADLVLDDAEGVLAPDLYAELKDHRARVWG